MNKIVYVGVGVYALYSSCASPTCGSIHNTTPRHGQAGLFKPDHYPDSEPAMRSLTLMCWALSRAAEPQALSKRLLFDGAGDRTTNLPHTKRTLNHYTTWPRCTDGIRESTDASLRSISCEEIITRKTKSHQCNRHLKIQGLSLNTRQG